MVVNATSVSRSVTNLFSKHDTRQAVLVATNGIIDRCLTLSPGREREA